jgi:hypothetical protein
VERKTKPPESGPLNLQRMFQSPNKPGIKMFKITNILCQLARNLSIFSNSIVISNQISTEPKTVEVMNITMLKTLTISTRVWIVRAKKPTLYNSWLKNMISIRTKLKKSKQCLAMSDCAFNLKFNLSQLILTILIFQSFKFEFIIN